MKAETFPKKAINFAPKREIILAGEALNLVRKIKLYTFPHLQRTTRKLNT